MFVYICFVHIWYQFRDGLKMSKISLFIRCRKQGCYIASVPLKKLVKLSKYRKKRWKFKDGWLILEAF